MMKFINIFLLVAILPLAGFFLFGKTKSVSLNVNEISKPLPHYSRWEVNNSSDEMNDCLNQSYKYLGKGAQSFAFVSEDEKYVIKFFKFKHLNLNFIQSLVPDFGPFGKWKFDKLQEKLKKLEKLFDAYFLAYNKHRDESAIVFLHLNKTDNNLPMLKIFDSFGKEILINLDEVPFIIQKKVEITKAAFDRLFKEKKLPEVKEKISQILKLYLSEYAKGIYDHDHGVMHNTGFIENTAVHLDVGKIYADESIKLKENAYVDLVKIGWKMREYMLKRHPDYEREITDHLNLEIGMAFQEKLDYDKLDGAILWKRRS